MSNGNVGRSINVDVQRVLAVKVDGSTKGYLDAVDDGSGNPLAVNVSTAKWDLSDAAAAISGTYLLNQDTAAAGVNLASGVTTDFNSTDRNLYTAYSTTLTTPIDTNGTLSATVTGKHQTNVAMAALTAKGATVNLKLTGLATNKEYQLKDTTASKNIGNAKKLSTATDELTATYTINGAAAFNATSGKRISVKVGSTSKTLVVDDSGAVNVNNLAKEAGVMAADYGKYLVELNSTTGVATTGDDITDGTVAAGFFTDGKTYEFGYYELKVATAFANTNMANTTVTIKLNGKTVAAPATSFYGKTGDTLTCDVVTDATGFTAGTNSQTLTINGTIPTITISEDYDTGTAPTITDATGLITYTKAESYTSGTVTATWTVASADINNIAFAVAKT